MCQDINFFQTYNEFFISDSSSEEDKCHSEPVVAFLVARTKHMGPVSRDTTISFDVIDFNIGGGFLSHASIFRAPVAGIYSMSTSFYSYDEQLPETKLTVNRKLVVASVPNSSTAALSVTMKLRRGDVVRVELLPLRQGMIHCYVSRVCFFSGHLISTLQN